MLKQIILIIVLLFVGGGSLFLGVEVLEFGNNQNITQAAFADLSGKNSQKLVPQYDKVNPSENEWYKGLVPEVLSRIHPKQFDVPYQKSPSQSEFPPRLIENLVVSDSFPYVVWEGQGENISYELWVGDTRYLVPPKTRDIVAVKIEKFNGMAIVQLKAFLDGQLISNQASVHKKMVNSLKWIEDSRIIGSIPHSFKDLPIREVVKAGQFLERQGMWVAAMSCYRQFSLDNPEELEIIPYLLRTYRKLNLMKIYQKEMENWSSAMKS